MKTTVILITLLGALYQCLYAQTNPDKSKSGQLNSDVIVTRTGSEIFCAINKIDFKEGKLDLKEGKIYYYIFKHGPENRKKIPLSDVHYYIWQDDKMIVSGEQRPQSQQSATLTKDTLILKKRIAVLEFANKAGSRGDEVTSITDMLITELVNTGRFIVMERSRIEAILNEQQFDASKGVTAQSSVELNKLLGVQMIITGSITEFGLKSESKGGSYGYVNTSSNEQTARVCVDLRLVNASTGEIMLAERAISEKKAKSGGGGVGGFSSSSSSNDHTIIDKAKRGAISKCVELVAQVMDKMPWEGKVIKINTTDNTLIMKPGSLGGVKPGMKFMVYSKGTEVIDPETGLSLGYDITKKGIIVVVKDFGDGQACVAKIISGTEYKSGDIIKTMDSK